MFLKMQMNIYGDYMQLPPKDKRGGHIVKVEYIE